MIPDAEVAQLVALLGEDGVEEHGPLEIDGATARLTLRPPDGKLLAGALKMLGTAPRHALVRGGGTRLALGNPPTSADAILSTERLAGVDTFDPEEGVCHAAAGTRLADLRAEVNAGGWELPLDPPGAGSTVGGSIAAAATGPRALAFGPVRDSVLGLEVALPSGDRIRSGGRVVKNVTGYDLNKVFTGSLGTLGVILGAWLRLRPLPERSEVLEATLRNLEAACEIGLAAARRPTARAVGVMAPGDSGPRLVAELAGDAPSVARDAEWLRGRGASDSVESAVDALRELQGTTEGLRFRLSVVASKLPGLVSALGERDVELLLFPEQGKVYAGFATGGSDSREAADSAWSRVAAAAEAVGGGFRLEAGPTWAKQGRDVFAGEGGPLPIIEALKNRFDPDRLLNPGRFIGHI